MFKLIIFLNLQNDAFKNLALSSILCSSSGLIKWFFTPNDEHDIIESTMIINVFMVNKNTTK